MAGDWLKLYRKLDESAVMDDAELLRLWIHLLIRANYKARQLMGGQVILPGQVIVSTIRLAARFGCSKSTIHRRLVTLKTLGQIELKAGNKWTTVTICNWTTYQDDSGDLWEANGTRAEHGRNAGGKQTETEEEGKKEKKGRRKEVSARPATLDEVATYFAERKSTATEAEEFWDHFESNGWLVSGKSPMRDWKAAARRWIRNPLGRKPSLSPSLEHRCQVPTDEDLAAYSPHG